MAMWPVKVQLGLQMKPKFSLNTPLNQSSDLHLPRQSISIDTQKCVCWVSVCTNHSSLTAVKWCCPAVNTLDPFQITFKRYLQTDRHQYGIAHVYQSVSPMSQKFFCPSLRLSASFVSLPCFVLLFHHSSLLCSLRDRDKEVILRMCHLGSQLTHIYHHQTVTGKASPVLPDYAVKKYWVEGKFHYSLTLTRLMSYIYGAPILDVSRSHTTTQHSR